MWTGHRFGRHDRSPRPALFSEQLGAIETAFRQLFQGRVHSHPAKLNAVLVQIGTETISIEFIATQKTLRIEGAKRLVSDISKLGFAVSDRTAQNSLKILSLNDNGQSSLTQLAHSARSLPPRRPATRFSTCYGERIQRKLDRCLVMETTSH
jgi:hypothetical protein